MGHRDSHTVLICLTPCCGCSPIVSVYWRVASEEINYRRFFDVNELAALSMEKPEVFLATHGLILRLLDEGKVHGVRIDHPDGLYDPQQYLQRLQQHYVLSVARRLRDTACAVQEEGEPDLETLLDTAMAQVQRHSQCHPAASALYCGGKNSRRPRNAP